MATSLGAHSLRLKSARGLQLPKGRRERGRFTFEGPTLLAEACAAGCEIEEIFATPEAYEATPRLRELEAAGTPVYLVSPAIFATLSDLATPSGILAVAPQRLVQPRQVLASGSPVLVLADVADPANAGSLLRSADAFGAPGVLFGSLGVDPYHPKVVRGSMGAIFRLEVAIAEPAAVVAAVEATGTRLLGLAAGGRPIAGEDWKPRVALVVGHERHGLGRWMDPCEALLAIPMKGPAESLSAAVAGSIALYEAFRHLICQESTGGPKSQDYQG
ncbi:MAG TPA: RNA methyltransferase [Candidatus Cybelea sp.]|nr:RNA methyltransferase [Candidatus Cybelea sp.]